MELYFVFFLLSAFIFLIRFYFSNNLKNRNLPPGPKGLPVIGSLLRLGPHPNQSLYELSKVHGPLMTLHLGSVTTMIVSSPEIAKHILQVHDQTFSLRHVPEAVAAQPNVEATLAWVPGDQSWRHRRRICKTQLFSVQSLNSLQHLRHQKVEQLIQHIKKQYSVLRSDQLVVDIGQVVFATTLNLISNTIFSIDIVDPEFNTAQEFKDLVWRIMEDGGKPNLSDYFPVLRRFDLQGIKKHIRPAYLRLHEIFEELIHKRLESRKLELEENQKSSSRDFLDVLLDQCQEDGSDFNTQTIKPLILDLFIAGSDTSAITTEWAMAELLKKPDTLQKTRQELIDVIGTQRAVQESDTDQLPYLQAVVKETLRLHPAAPLLLPYKASNNVQVCGYTIPQGTQVLVNAWAIGRDPNYWEDPLSFFPERFLGSDIDFKGRNFEYIPFGAGRRICPGWPLAIRMVHLLLASIIHSFEWKLPEEIYPETLDMKEQFGVTLKKAVPLRAIPILDEKK